ncbi:lipoprotein N-acyltransferase Lnb domain-containing protein [Polaribacter sp. OB-PA-B3]
MIKKLLIVLPIFLLLFKINHAQKLSTFSEISIVTAGPGKELYEKFGHSAIRIKDPSLNLDVIYNYGIFDFDKPNFLLNFAQGKMYYLLAKYDFVYFFNSYMKDKRWLKQQVLNLTLQEKQDYYSYLENNALKQNATYLYDPFFNNCASKLKDISLEVLKENLILESNTIENNKTLRHLMNNEITWNTWGNFGINLIAGTILDKERNQVAYTYLPDYLYKTSKSAKIKRNGKTVNFVKREDILLNYEEVHNNNFIVSPIFIFSILLIIVLLITFRNIKNNKRSKFLDFLIFFITGLIGLALSYLWLFSSHTTAPNNFNILWAFLPNIIIAFLLLRKSVKHWVRNYLKVIIVLLNIVLLLWIFDIQSFPITLIPILILLNIRYFYLLKNLLPSIK